MAGPAAAGRFAILVLLGLAILVGVSSGRLLLDGRRHLDQAARHQAAGDQERALVSLEEAARAYLPGSPYPARALDQLSLVARTHEMRGEAFEARKAWEIIRRSILASRHVYQPQAALLETAERKILDSRAAEPGAGVGAEAVARPDDPRPIVSLLLFLGVLSWMGGAAALLCAGPSRPGRKLRALGWIAALGGLALWLSMSWLAG